MSLSIHTNSASFRPALSKTTARQGLKRFEKTIGQGEQQITVLDVNLYLKSKEFVPKFKNPAMKAIQRKRESKSIVQIVVTPPTPNNLSIPHFPTIEVDEELLSPYWEPSTSQDLGDFEELSSEDPKTIVSDKEQQNDDYEKLLNTKYHSRSESVQAESMSFYENLEMMENDWEDSKVVVDDTYTKGKELALEALENYLSKKLEFMQMIGIDMHSHLYWRQRSKVQC